MTGETPEYDPGNQLWRYKGWTFFSDLGRFQVHGPNSTGRRARKIVGSYASAVEYVDQHASRKDKS